MCGGGGSGTSKDQLNLENQRINDQLAKQDAIRQQIMGGMGKYLTGSGEGFDPQMLAQLKSQFLDQNAMTGQQAGNQVMSALAARGMAGGNLPTSGTTARDLAALQGMISTNQSSGIANIGIQNLQQALNNRFNAANVASGQAAQLGGNIGTFQGGANNALSNYVQAQQSTFGNQFFKGLGSSLGSGIGNLATFGIGSSLGNIGSILGRGSGAASAPQPGLNDPRFGGFGG